MFPLSRQVLLPMCGTVTLCAVVSEIHPVLGIFSAHFFNIWLKLKPGHSLKAINSKAKKTTGSFKLVPKNKRKIQPKLLSAMIAPRKPSGAKEKGPKKPSETKDPLNPGMVRIPKKPGEVKKTLSKPGAVDKKAPKKFSPSLSDRP